MIPTDFAFGLFTGPCHGPPAPRHLPHGGQRRRVWRNNAVRRQRRRSAQTPAYQEPAAPVSLPRGGQGPPPPVLPARPLRPVTSTQPLPARRRPRRQDVFDGVLPTRPPDLCFARDRQDRGVVLLFQPHPEPPVIAIDAIAGHPRGGHTRREGPLEHVTRQLRFRGKTLLGRYPSGRATRTVVGPDLGEREGAVQQGVAMHTRVRQPPPIGPCSTRPAGPLYCRAPPPACWPCGSNPVSSRPSTAWGSPLDWTTEARNASRTASAAQRARPTTCGTP